MASPAGAAAGAYDATVAVDENPADQLRALRRLRNDVEASRCALELIEDAPDRVKAKYAKLEVLLKGKAAELAEAKAMVAAAKQALADAEAALAETEG